MKTKERTAVNALAWDKLVLLKELSDPENLKGLDIKWVLRKMNDPFTVYYSDAPSLALMEYIVEKNCVIRTPFKIVLKVRTKSGKGYMYSRALIEPNFETDDLVDLIKQLVSPMTSRMIAEARRDVKLEDVASVSAYVEDL
jgi:hypothetical protein